MSLSWELGCPQISEGPPTDQQKVDTEGTGMLDYLPSLGSRLIKTPRSALRLTTPPFQDVQKGIADSKSLGVPDQLPRPAASTSPPDSDAISPSQESSQASSLGARILSDKFLT